MSRLTLFLCLFLVACDPPHRPQIGQPMPQQTFAHITAQSVSVGFVDVVNGAGGAVVPDDFAFSLVDQTLLYLSRKFMAASGGGVLRLRVEEARVDRGHVSAKDAITKKLGVGGQDEYAIHLRIALERIGADGRVVYGKTLSAQQILRVSEHCSLADRERDQLRAVEAAFQMLDPEVNRVVLDEMGLRSVH